MPDRSDAAEDSQDARHQLAVLTVTHMDGLRIDRLALRLLDDGATRPTERGPLVNSVTAILLAVFLLLGNAFFVAAEFALVSARRYPDRAAGRGRQPLRAHHAAGDGEHVRGDRRQPARDHRLLAGPRCRRRARGRPPDRAGPARRCTCPRRSCTRSPSRSGWSIVVYLHVVMGEMIPKNIALAGPDRAALVLGTPGLGLRHRAAPGDPGDQRRRQRAAAARRGAADGRGELDVHPRGGRGPRRGVPRRGAAPGGRVRPAGRRARLHREHRGLGADAARHPDHGPAGRHGRRGRGRLRGHRLQPVPGHRTTTGSPCSATCTSRTSSSPTRRGASASIEPSWIRPFAPVRADRLPARRPGDPAAPRRPHGDRQRRRGRAARAWPRSRTSSRSWSARSATPPTSTSRRRIAPGTPRVGPVSNRSCGATAG